MRARNTDRIVRGIALSVVLLGVAGMGASRWMGRASAPRLIRDYHPDSAVPRIPFDGTIVEGILLGRDFDVVGADMYLLDMAAPRVVFLHNTDDRWKVSGGFGKRGGGPGELLQPSGIAVTDSPRTIIIADQNRLHFFDAAGSYVRSLTPELPCTMAAPQVAAVDGAILMSGRCVRGDTVFAELFHIAGNAGISIVRDVLYTMDGKTGSVFGASSFFTTSTGGGTFGGGTSDCTYRINVRNEPPQSTSVCGLGSSRYAFVPDEHLVAKAKAVAAARPWIAAALTLPDRLPVYVDRISIDGVSLLLRPVNNDSVAFRVAGSEADLAIAPVEGLIGCRAAGCLWIQQDTVAKMMFVPAARISTFVRTQ
ncbi:MAG: hypothetical protein ABIV28_06045 [Longimicrobiales bacterium]